MMDRNGPAASREKLDIKEENAFPSCVLLKKRPIDLTPQEKADALKKMKTKGEDIMSRLRNFMPAMEESKRILEEKLRKTTDPEELDIENTDDAETAVEIDLALFQYDSDSDPNAESDVTDASDSDEPDLPEDESRHSTTEASASTKRNTRESEMK